MLASRVQVVDLSPVCFVINVASNNGFYLLNMHICTVTPNPDSDGCCAVAMGHAISDFVNEVVCSCAAAGLGDEQDVGPRGFPRQVIQMASCSSVSGTSFSLGKE